jgi:hypothetical protein
VAYYFTASLETGMKKCQQPRKMLQPRKWQKYENAA